MLGLRNPLSKKWRTDACSGFVVLLTAMGLLFPPKLAAKAWARWLDTPAKSKDWQP